MASGDRLSKVMKSCQYSPCAYDRGNRLAGESGQDSVFIKLCVFAHLVGLYDARLCDSNTGE